MHRKIFLIPLFIVFTIPLFAFGAKDKDIPTVQVTGVVRLVGSALFPELVIIGSEDVWHITAAEINKLIEMQHHTVTVEAEETVIELKFANGEPAGIRRELSNIKIKTIH